MKDDKWEGQQLVLYKSHFLNLLTRLCFVKIITVGQNSKGLVSSGSQSFISTNSEALLSVSLVRVTLVIT